MVRSPKGPGLCCSWPGFPDHLQLSLTLKPSDTYTSGLKKPFPTSAPTFEDFKRLEGGGMGQRGKERQVIMEESGVLGEPETPSGDLLGYRL